MWLGILTAALGLLKSSVGPIFGWLNARVDASARVHLSDNETMTRVGSTVIDGASKADELEAQLRLKEGKWSPLAVFSYGFLSLFLFHIGQVVLDSCRWLPLASGWYGIPYITFVAHAPGSWAVAALPSPVDSVEMYAITSLFIGAGVGMAGAMVWKAVKR